MGPSFPLLYKIVNSILPACFCLDSFSEASCHFFSFSVARPAWQATEAPTPKTCKVLNPADNLMSLEVDPSTVKPSGETPSSG